MYFWFWIKVFLNGVLFIIGYKNKLMFMKILIEYNCEIKIMFDWWIVFSEWSSVVFFMVDEVVLFFVCLLCKYEIKL